MSSEFAFSPGVGCIVGDEHLSSYMGIIFHKKCWWAQNKGQTLERLFSNRGMKTVPSYIRIDFISHEFRTLS